MSETYEVGSVAAIKTTRLGITRAIRANHGWYYAYTGGMHFAADHEVTDVRPLVVLDPCDIPPLRDWLPDHEGDYDADDMRLAALADQIEAQTRPPKPPEPTAIGSRVAEANGVAYTRYSDSEHGPGQPGDWINEDGVRVQWRDINAVRELSKGVPMDAE